MDNEKQFWPQGHTPQSHKQSFKKQPYPNAQGNRQAPQAGSPGSNPQQGSGDVQAKERGYKKLIAWQKADELALQVYKATDSFPRDEIYGVRSQIRRAALSVPTNLVEGNGRQNRKEFKHYVNIALGSLSEVEYLLDFALKLGYFSSEQHETLCGTRNFVGALLWKLHQSISE